jgi:hypothetical protein
MAAIESKEDGGAASPAMSTSITFVGAEGADEDGAASPFSPTSPTLRKMMAYFAVFTLMKTVV